MEQNIEYVMNTGHSLKRIRTSPINSNNQQVYAINHKKPYNPLKMLNSLEKDDLLRILHELIQVNPQVNYQLSQIIPKPNLNWAINLLLNLEKKLWEALPYDRINKAGPKSDYSFNRIKPILNELKCNLNDLMDYFNYTMNDQDLDPTISISFLTFVITFVQRLPDWTNDEYQKIMKIEIFEKALLCFKLTIIETNNKFKQDGKMFGTFLLNEWHKNITEISNNLQGKYGSLDLLQTFINQLGYLIGIYPNNNNF
jgi:hypothetical protein